MRVLIISNATARARHRVPAIREVLPESGALVHSITREAGELSGLVGHDRWQPEDLLVVNGGDGSVQHVLTHLLNHCPPQQLPRLACLPGGTTNMTAFDINIHRSFRRCLETLGRVTAAEPGRCPTAPRPVVRVLPRTGVAAGARYGLFFGTGTIVQGIEYFQQRVRPSGGRHELGAGVAMVRALWGILRGQPPFAEPLPVEVHAPGLLTPGVSCSGNDAPAWQPLAVRLLLMTSLDRLLLGMRPYWSDGAAGGALRATLVESRAPRLMRSMPRLLRGRPSPSMTPAFGYHSGRADQVQLRFRGSYTLDGELFVNGGDTIAVQASVPVRFVPL
jgi:diacylglycerol kinase (ATP)